MTMREILFRGKRTDNGEWVHGYYIAANYSWHKYGVHRDWIVAAACANGGWFALHGRYPVVTDTVGQFTGLTDKNGTKIFEGDVLRYYSDFMREFIGDLCIARYGEFNCSCCDGVYGWFFESGDIREHDSYVVIGNIHDNPELMEDEYHG